MQMQEIEVEQKERLIEVKSKSSVRARRLLVRAVSLIAL